MQRPKRSTRGIKPQRTTEELAKDEQLYTSFFGEQAFEQNEIVDPEQEKKEQARLARNGKLKNNLENYAYVRAFHYFYNIDQIPRLQGHPSYVEQGQYAFGWKYSQDHKLFRNQPLGNIVNRLYLGLPRSSATPQKQDGDQKLEKAFELQERRYSIDRIIYTCKILMNRLASFVKNGKIKEFRNIAKRDPEFQLLWEEDTSLATKKKLLQKKLKEFERKKEMRVKILNDQQHKLLIEAVENEQPGSGAVDLEQEGSMPLKKIKLS